MEPVLLILVLLLALAMAFGLAVVSLRAVFSVIEAPASTTAVREPITGSARA
ncbi:MAG TPA: hypothetical protein VKE70_01300 [Candidatus Solibacter sp.]|nr:hypothetical protein [Candidatus Solibacter sp.]